MILNSVLLKNFRLHKNQKFNFSEKTNYIIGGNGLGKTSVLEAVYYLCTTKSPVSNTDSEAVSFGEKSFEITGKFKDLTEDLVKVIYSTQDNKKKYFLNNKLVKKHSGVIGRYPVVLLAPLDHAITQGSPADRRKFIDSIISQASDTYLKTLIQYNRILKNRSSLLNQIKEKPTSSLLEQLLAWDSSVASIGTELILYRKNFINEFLPFMLESYKEIMNEDEKPNIILNTMDNYQPLNHNETLEKFLELININKPLEIKRGRNLVGPHRDDFIFELNDLNLKTFGSQGQHKTFQVVLRFAEYFYLKNKTGKNPIFLLDDVFGELDSNRAKKISEYLKKIGQVFISITDFTNISYLKKDEDDCIITLSSGAVSYA